jgi:phosphoribosylamine--glycine ligase
MGIVDFFTEDEHLKNIPILGPPAEGARLEASKSFAKAFMQRHNIPTASYRVFQQHEYEAAKQCVMNHSLPVVIKADGLSAGKGVSVCSTKEAGLEFLAEIFENNKFGRAGCQAVIEQFLDGIELSVFILTDGKNYVLLPEAKDYKRIGEGDTGPNTGGMGSISPVPFADESFMAKVKTKVIDPTINGLREERIQYRGFIFFGLINVGGEPMVIEYNARMGDPETQVVFPRIKSDIVPLFLQAARGELSTTHIDINPDYAAAVIAVSQGYPGSYESGKKISGLEMMEDSIVFQAGTKMSGDECLTAGGRVLAVTSLSPGLKHAIEKSYKSLSAVSFSNMAYRKDIGQDLLKYTERT